MANSFITMKGKPLDMAKLKKKHELTVAAGNAGVNARGDEIGKFGKIKRSRDEVVRQHYSTASSMHDQVTVTRAQVTPEMSAQEAQKKQQLPKRVKPAEPVVAPAQTAVDGEWLEDQDGNFIRKEDQ